MSVRAELLKKDMGILHQHAPALSALARERRQHGLALSEEKEKMNMPQVWSARSLHEALSAQNLFCNGHACVELLEGSESSLHLTMHDYGDLPLFIAVHGEQILIEALLWPQADVKDPAAFNAEVLRSHKLFTLSPICLETLPGGAPCYGMYGALSAYSNLSNVVLAIEALADNVIKATEAFQGYLKAPA